MADVYLRNYTKVEKTDCYLKKEDVIQAILGYDEGKPISRLFNEINKCTQYFFISEEIKNAEGKKEKE